MCTTNSNLVRPIFAQTYSKCTENMLMQTEEGIPPSIRVIVSKTLEMNKINPVTFPPDQKCKLSCVRFSAGFYEHDHLVMCVL